MKKILIKIWRYFFPKKYNTVKPSSSHSLVNGTTSGIEPVRINYYSRRKAVKVTKEGQEILRELQANLKKNY